MATHQCSRSTGWTVATPGPEPLLSGGADPHRRGEDERADPGDHPGRRRRDGSFDNHFETKEELFEAAVEAVMDGTVGCSTTCRRHRGPGGGVPLRVVFWSTPEWSYAGA